MLSFGQYCRGQSSIPYAQFQYGYFPSHIQDVTQTQTPGTNLPLTPPGSPDDEAPLVICESPQKTPQKPFSTGRTGESECGMGAIKSAYTHPTATAYPVPYSGIDPTAAQLPPTDLENPFANFFYGTNVRSPSVFSLNSKRSRHEKQPVPAVMKDDKYFERRRRNNAAAKKSRDSRKNREDEIATRAAFLEKENAVLRAQVATLREEAQNLRLLLLQKRERQVTAQTEATVSFS